MKAIGVMKATPYEEARLLNQGRFQYHWSLPCLIQPKLNGFRCRAVVDHADHPAVSLTASSRMLGNSSERNSHTILFSSSGNQIISVPHITYQLDQTKWWEHLPEGAELDGELYAYGMNFEGENGIEAICSRTENLHPSYDKMQYWLFDIKYPAITQVARLELLSTVKTTNNVVKVVTNLISNLNKIDEYLKEYIDIGYEGFILRDKDNRYEEKRSLSVMKFKPSCTDEYTIADVKEAISLDGFRTGLAGRIVVTDGQTEFSIGPGKLTHNQRDKLLYFKSSFIGKPITVGYQMKMESGQLRHGIAISIQGL